MLFGEAKIYSACLVQSAYSWAISELTEVTSMIDNMLSSKVSREIWTHEWIKTL